MIRLRKTLIPIAIFVFMLAACFTAYAHDNSAVILMEPMKTHFEVGDHVKYTIRIHDLDGSYLKSVDCGFGYNAATMKKLTDTDTVDHVYMSSDAPQKVFEKEIEFELVADGKNYFILGAYEGAGVAKGYRADGSRIYFPRASVLYKIGTGIYSDTSDCNASELEIYDADTGDPIEFNRTFDKNIVEYWATSQASAIRVNAKAELAEDKVILPTNCILSPGMNDIKVGIQSVGGKTKDYVVHISKAAIPAQVSAINIFTDKGEPVEYDFDPGSFEYDIEVSQDAESLNWEVEAIPGCEVKYPEPSIDEGYNFRDVTVTTETDEKTYSYFIHRQMSELKLSSLVVEKSDETVMEMDIPFNPDINDYSGSVTADVRQVTLNYTLGNDRDRVLEEDNVRDLVAGDNKLTITVTNGVSENIYTVHVHKDEYEVVTEPETEPPAPYRNTESFKTINERDLTLIAIGFSALILIALVIAGIKYSRAHREYKTTKESLAEQDMAERKKRLAEKERQRRKEKKEREKGK